MTETAVTGRKVDAGTARILRLAYQGLVKAGNDSVRAAWRFGQALDSFTDRYTQAQLSDALDLSVSTVARYQRLYRAYQRAELALEAAEQLQTYNIDTLTELQNTLHPVEHGRPLAGRHWTFTCRNCHSHDVARVEVDEDGNPVAAGDEAGAVSRPRDLIEGSGRRGDPVPLGAAPAGLMPTPGDLWGRLRA